MKNLASFLVVLGISLASLPALADALPPDPCDGKVEGDACVDMSNTTGVCKPGTACVPSPPCLVCDVSGTISSSSSSGGGSTSSSSGSASSSSGSASSSSGSGTETDDGGGCALSPGARETGAVVAAVLGLLGIAAAARRKRR
jgi:hypothetical protein